MPSRRRTRAAVENSWDSACPRRTLALALCCAGVIGLLAIVGVAAQATTDYDRDDDGLIEVDSLEKLNAIRWDLDGDGDGTADDLDSNGTADYDEAFPIPPPAWAAASRTTMATPTPLMSPSASAMS